MTRKILCGYCGSVVEYEATRGKARKCCNSVCAKKALAAKIVDRSNQLSDCATPGCKGKANRVGVGLCEACYMRLRRKGTTDKKEVPYKSSNTAGYIRLRERDHILSDTTGTVYEHRFVYHREHGEGPFNCHWCGKVVTWFDMHVDHVDVDITNNSPSNLVASCPSCNQKRGREKMTKTAQSLQGTWIEFRGEKRLLSQWAKIVGITRTALQYRLANGWSIERALTEIKGPTGPKRDS